MFQNMITAFVPDMLSEIGFKSWNVNVVGNVSTRDGTDISYTPDQHNAHDTSILTSRATGKACTGTVFSHSYVIPYYFEW